MELVNFLVFIYGHINFKTKLDGHISLKYVKFAEYITAQIGPVIFS